MPAVVYLSEAGVSGYSLAAYAYMRTLLANGVEVSWQPQECVFGRMRPCYRAQSSDPELQACLFKPVKTDRVVLHLIPSQIASLHHRFRGWHRTVVTVWETERIPSFWSPQLNRAHRVLVPCRWNRDVFQQCGVTTPVEVLPYLFTGDVPRRSARGEGPLVFYSIGQWTGRKGIPTLVDAYLRAFTSGERTLLVLKTSAKDLSSISTRFAVRHLLNARNSSRRTLDALVRRHAAPAAIELLAGDLPRQAILDLHARGDCYVSLTRSEGWGLGAFEASGSDHPVVITGHGAPSEFLQSPPSYLVDYQLVPCQPSAYENLFTADQHWAEPNVEQAVEFLRNIYDRPADAYERGRQQGERVRQEFSVATLAPSVVRLLSGP